MNWDYILKRLEEPSTYAGGSLLAIILSSVLPPGIAGHILDVGASVGALVAVLKPEKPTVTIVEPVTVIKPEKS